MKSGESSQKRGGHPFQNCIIGSVFLEREGQGFRDVGKFLKKLQFFCFKVFPYLCSIFCDRDLDGAGGIILGKFGSIIDNGYGSIIKLLSIFR